MSVGWVIPFCINHCKVASRTQSDIWYTFEGCFAMDTDALWVQVRWASWPWQVLERCPAERWCQDYCFPGKPWGKDFITISDGIQVSINGNEVHSVCSCNSNPNHHGDSSLTIPFNNTAVCITFQMTSMYTRVAIRGGNVKPELVSEHHCVPPSQSAT